MILRFGRRMNMLKDKCTILLGTILLRLYEFNDSHVSKDPEGWNIASGCKVRTFLIDNIHIYKKLKIQCDLVFRIIPIRICGVHSDKVGNKDGIVVDIAHS